ncbi:hypothetical protein [Martelella sp. AD-3]|uniref:spike base protein, RCAP_Rcc01079 family n=1 Tax=Martelella sp. AD-3 TaxID=686597 RepID=UPI000465E13D|nr:hypothetical protein [Martelella sp. AD-3]AMM84818.1 hypothetical protein AZF01_10985 [Martelella sp. AD-3]
MTELKVYDATGVQRPIAAETNPDGSISPRHGFSTEAAALVEAVRDAVEIVTPARRHRAVTPSDDAVLEDVLSVFVGFGGAIAIEAGGGVAVYHCQSGTLLPVAAHKVLATGTTASEIVALVK